MTSDGTTTTSLERLEKVASKQEEWKNLDPSQKLKFIDEILVVLHKIGLAAWTENAKHVAELFQVPPSSPLGEFVVAEETMINFNCVSSSVAALKAAYKIRLGQDNPVLTQLKMDKAVNGQVKAKVFPLTPTDSINPLASAVGEIWFEPNVEMDQIRPFDFEKLEEPTKGAFLVLGAGNHDFLTIIDALQGLFVMNQVVYVKLHPLRNHLDKLLRQIFEPLIREGYFDTEQDVSVARSSELVYSEFVGAVHMTGGKGTHDAIVWGSDPNERKDRIARQDPKLKARMTSELGCVTPWIVAAGEYTPKELDHQAQSVFSAIHFRGSANCNCPNTIVLAKSWAQREEFVETILQVWQKREAPLVYYPGAKDRWEALQKAYPNSSRVIESKPSDDEEREAVLKKISLPLLAVDIDVDITTPEGIEKAKSEYAFSHESFAPVLVVVVIDDTKEGAQPFLELATKFCNEFLFGSLSCAITIPPSLDGSETAEKAIADLKYGTVGVNIYSGMSYSIAPLTWGAVPGERLDSVESGIGKVQNRLFLPHVEKCVLRTPIICLGHLIQKDQPLSKSTSEYLMVSRILIFLSRPWVKATFETISRLFSRKSSTVSTKK